MLAAMLIPELSRLQPSSVEKSVLQVLAILLALFGRFEKQAGSNASIPNVFTARPCYMKMLMSVLIFIISSCSLWKALAPSP